MSCDNELLHRLYCCWIYLKSHSFVIYVFSAVLCAVSGEVVWPEEVQVHGSRPPPPPPLPSWRRLPVGVALLWTPQLLLLPLFFLWCRYDLDILFSIPPLDRNMVMSFCKAIIWCDMTCPKWWLPDKLLSARVYPDSQIQRPAVDPPGGPGLMFPLTGGNMGRQDGSKPWAPGPGGGSAGSGAPRGFGGAGGEVDEETKKNQNIINIVREGQISLLVSGKHSDQWKSRRWAI